MNSWLKRLIIALVVILILALIILIPQETYRELTAEEVVSLDRQRKEAYNFAVACSGTTSPAVRFEDITWVIVPGYQLVIEATDGTARLKGFYNPTDSTIYMPFTERDTRWIMAHESLHAIGYIGHPRVPFETCGLMADQNP